MANSIALFVVALVLCVANAGRVSAEPARKLTAVPVVYRKLVIVFDLTKVNKTVAQGTATLNESVQGAKRVVARLVPGYVTELKAAHVQLREAGTVRVTVRILGLNKAIALDLQQLKATLVGGEMRAVAVLVLETVKKSRILHFRNQDGQCLAGNDFNLTGGFNSNFTGFGSQAQGGSDFNLQP